ncbi:inositol polyphosphate 5-phosphatase K-like [Sinocyclocheilus grahami]|uniref:inositol polyphosphate 5-phosphatase K-like n=1 Tax=Sinocyclocheilus grahami TaxID=75366 RepID=UPI0007ACCCEA|nr:PREDICTED: inositol polyphosphate 5-phosphatase K-like [Sinocyclocheilus grahami]
MLFVRNCITSQRYNLLWPKDQLTMMKQKKATLQKFEEGPLDFQPTYKFDLNSDNYDTRVQKTWFGFNGKKRKPAWCDRILWRVKPKSSLSEDANEDGQNQEDPKKQLEEQHKDEFPLKLSQEFYTSKLEYGISDHKPVIGIFRFELRKIYETPLLQVCAEGEWSADFDALITYSLPQSFPSSAWDWIGLYKVGFKSVSDYITYTWVKDDQVSFTDELFQVYVNKDEIPVLGGECVLCYYSSNLQCIVGISQPFKVSNILLLYFITAVTPEEWESLCILNISKAEKEKNNSLSLRALVDSLLEQTAADMRRQYEATGRAFELRIEETKTAKTQLENQLNELLAETANQEKNLESLRVAIAEKDAPFKVAQTRLFSRSQRPNVELCHDPAQIRLLEEVKELANHIER